MQPGEMFRGDLSHMIRCSGLFNSKEVTSYRARIMDEIELVVPICFPMISFPMIW